MTAPNGESAEQEHEPHGRCVTCGYPVHRYPFGWQHVGSGMFSCTMLVPRLTCCTPHNSRTNDG